METPGTELGGPEGASRALITGPDGAAQVSITDDPARRSTRAAIVRVLAYGFGFLLLLGGLRLLVTGPSLAHHFVGGVFAVIGGWVAVRVFRAAHRALRSWMWYRRNRCIHCGYAIDPLLGIKCPECGKEPLS